MSVALAPRSALRAPNRPRVSPLALAVWAVLARPVWAEEAFKVDPRLLLVSQVGVAAAGGKPAAPTIIEAEVIDGRTDQELNARGNVRVERDGTVLQADKLHFDQVTNDAEAEGKVLLQRGEDSVRGPRAKINIDTHVGTIDSPDYTLNRRVRDNEAPIERTGSASKMDLEGENQYRLFNSTYTTCPAPNPDWYLKSSEMELDFDRDKGLAKHTSLVFKDVPIAYLPWMEFPLSGGRQSGFLPPSIGSSTNTGTDIAVPYYFDIAPNYDATMVGRWMGRRGGQVGGEFRYLGESGGGKVLGEYMPRDEVTGTSRGLGSLIYGQSFGQGWSGFVNATQVSDVDYFADLSTRVDVTSQSNLNQQVGLNYSNGTWLSSALNVQRYQVITGSAPYSRLPQLTARMTAPDVGGFNLQMPLELTDFYAVGLDTGQRGVMYPQVSYPIQGAAYFVVPKIGASVSQYNLERVTSSGASNISRVVPIGSLDAGLFFERDAKFGDTEYIQTLEPRAYYVRAGYVDQSTIPVFDTAAADYNFMQLYSENIFSGYDRIANANQLTLGLNSRFIDPANGGELLRMGVAQRFYFEDQKVTLPGVAARQGSVADVLFGMAGKITKNTWLDTLLQYDNSQSAMQQAAVTLRYQPAFAKALSVSWRYNEGQFRDLDIAGQWPIAGGWYGVGRVNNNLRDDVLSEAMGGLEYKGDCWVFRTVFQTLINTKQERNNSVFIQLELNGLASIGSSPVQMLRRSVSGYGKVNDSDTAPVFGAR